MREAASAAGGLTLVIPAQAGIQARLSSQGSAFEFVNKSIFLPAEAKIQLRNSLLEWVQTDKFTNSSADRVSSPRDLDKGCWRDSSTSR